MKLRLILAAASAFLLTGSAAAQSTKIYPGAFCVMDGTESVSTLSYNWGVRAENTSATTKVVNCPIIRDADSDRPISATIYVYDSQREEAVLCKFQSWSANGASRLESPYYNSGTGYVGSRTLTMTGLSTGPGYTYNFLCRVPQGSYVSSYKIEEN